MGKYDYSLVIHVGYFIHIAAFIHLNLFDSDLSDRVSIGSISIVEKGS